MRERLQAVSISQPVMATLEGKGFAGSVFSVFAEVCNLISDQGEIVALVSQPVGNGPLNIVLEGNGFLSGNLASLPVEGDGHGIHVGKALMVNLVGAEVWQPRPEWARPHVEHSRSKANLAVLYDHLIAEAPAESLVYLLVTDPARGHSIKSAYQNAARKAIEKLLAALWVGNRQGIIAGAAALAGLGPGLTPAGDDFLLGLMAGLRTWPQFLEERELSVEEICHAIYEAAAGRTSLLSIALLRSAREGMFGEAWHTLLATLRQGKADEVRQAADRVLGFGRTSGADALAGFLSILSWFNV